NGRGRVNGLVNGVGRVNGMVNGRGRVNGLVNGVGRVNGMVNGQGPLSHRADIELDESANGKPPRRRLIFLRYCVIILSLVFLFSVSVSLIPEEPEKISRITIDGELADWSGIDRYLQQSTSPNPNIDIEDFSLVVEKKVVSFLVTVRGTILGDRIGYDAVYIFIDIDGSEVTGYLHTGLGVDYAIEIYGGNNSVEHSSLLRFESNDQYNWSAFHSIGRVKSKASGKSLEVQVMTSSIDPITDRTLFAFHTSDFDGGEAHSSLHIGREYGSLEVKQESIEGSCILESIPQSVLRLSFMARGSAVSVESVVVSLHGQGQLSSIPPFTVQPSETVVKIVSISSLSAEPEELIGVSLVEVRADRAVTIHGKGAKCYFEKPPNRKMVDGWFGDWNESILTDSQDLSFDHRNVDIFKFASVYDELRNETFFYAKVYGKILEGSSIPKVVQKPKKVGEPSPVSPAPVRVVPRKTGEDFLRIYIDSNSTDKIWEGQMRPDFMIQITGVDGEILNRSVFSWKNGWKYLSGPPAENNEDSIEVSLSRSVFSVLENTTVVFEMTDWRRTGDRQLLQTEWHSNWRTRSVYVIQTTTSSATSTAFSTQRKLFYDGTYFWSFYYDGGQSQTMYEYSSDGSTWTSTPVSAFSTSDVRYASVWYDSSNSAVYIVGDTTASDTTVIVRKGTISGTSISWGSEYTVTVSGASLGSKVAYITRASDGYIWVISSC
ncbi:MAG: hypothetical protein ACE5KV_08115, partial [Thermoplasmata archaeon]